MTLTAPWIVSACDYNFVMYYDPAWNGTALSQTLSGIEQEGIVFPTVTNPYLDDATAINAFIASLAGGEFIEYTFDSETGLCTLQSYALHFPLTQMFLIQDITGMPMPYQLPIIESNCTIIPDAGVERGCTNPLALNYNSEATSDDGSCQLPMARSSDDRDEELAILNCKVADLAYRLLQRLRSGSITRKEYDCEMTILWKRQKALSFLSTFVYTGTIVIPGITPVDGVAATADLSFLSLVLGYYFNISVTIAGVTAVTIADFYSLLSSIIVEVRDQINAGGVYTAQINVNGIVHIIAPVSLGASANGKPVIATIGYSGFSIQRTVDQSDALASSAGEYIADFGGVYWAGGNYKGIYLQTNATTLSTYPVHNEISQFVPQANAYSGFTSRLYMYEAKGASGLHDRLYAIDAIGTELAQVADFGALANASTSRMKVSQKNGYLWIPFGNLNLIRVWDCSGGAVPEIEVAAISPIPLTNGLNPVWVDDNPEPTDPFYGYCYVACQDSNSIVLIDPSNSGQTDVALGFSPYKFIFVPNSGGTGNYHIWMVGITGGIKVYDLSMNLITTIALTGTTRVDICYYESVGMVFVSCQDPAIQLQVVRVSDYAVIIPAYSFTTPATYAPTNLVYNPVEERIYAPHAASGLIYVLEWVDDSLSITTVFSGGVTEIDYSRDPVLQLASNNCITDDQADTVFQTLKEDVQGCC